MDRKNLILVLFCLLIVGIFFSKAILSIILGILLLIGIFTKSEQEVKFGLNTHSLALKNIKERGIAFFGFAIYFVWICLSGIWSQNLDSYQSEIISKLLYIGIPAIFIVTPKLEMKDVKLLHYFLIGIVVFCYLLVLLAYIPNFEIINESIGRGKAIPTPIDHVRFSMISSYTILATISLLLFYNASPREKNVLLVITVFLIILQHILAVRTGLALLYIGIGIIILLLILKRANYILGFSILGLVIILPIIAYLLVPSIKQKVEYTMNDWSVALKGDSVGKSYSDSDRITSIKNGIAVWQKSWLFGVGAGDYYIEMEREYKNFGPLAKRLLPHNQFIRTGMAYGLIGNILLLFAMLLPFYKRKQRSNILLIILIGIYLFSFLVESNLERYYIMIFFFLFLGFNIQGMAKKSIVEEIQ